MFSERVKPRYVDNFVGIYPSRKHSVLPFARETHAPIYTNELVAGFDSCWSSIVQLLCIQVKAAWRDSF